MKKLRIRFEYEYVIALTDALNKKIAECYQGSISNTELQSYIKQSEIEEVIDEEINIGIAGSLTLEELTQIARDEGWVQDG